MQRKVRILVVEDETAIRTGLIDVFVFHGYETEGVADGREGLQRALGGTFDLVLLDVMLPGIDGFEICNRIRERDRDLPIIMLTAKSEDADVIQGLSLGADDYVAKPFSVAQLVLRVQAVLRRSHVGTEQDVLRLGELEILQYLLAHEDRPVPREELLAKVWGYGRNLGIETRTVDIHVAKLRRKIERDPAEPRHLLTVRGAGYRLSRPGLDPDRG
jgi:two-component system response regulator RegX3